MRPSQRVPTHELYDNKEAHPWSMETCTATRSMTVLHRSFVFVFAAEDVPETEHSCNTHNMDMQTMLSVHVTMMVRPLEKAVCDCVSILESVHVTPNIAIANGIDTYKYT